MSLCACFSEIETGQSDAKFSEVLNFFQDMQVFRVSTIAELIFRNENRSILHP